MSRLRNPPTIPLSGSSGSRFRVLGSSRRKPRAYDLGLRVTLNPPDASLETGALGRTLVMERHMAEDSATVSSQFLRALRDWPLVC